MAALVAAVGVAVVLLVGSNSDQPENVATTLSLRNLTHIHGIAVDPRNSAELLLATHNGIFRTADGTTVARVSASQDDFMGFSLDPADSQVIYASGHPSTGGSAGVIVSRDGGLTWERRSPGVSGPVDFHAMTVSRADPNLIFGYFAHTSSIQVSGDGGRTWSIASSPPGVVDLAASPEYTNVVYAATNSGLIVSQDGGESWQPTGPQGQPATMVEAAPDGNVYAFVVGVGLLRAPASANVWNEVGDYISFGSALLHFAADPDNRDRLYAVDDLGRIMVSGDRGASWVPWAG